MKNLDVLDDLQPDTNAELWVKNLAILVKINKLALGAGIIWLLLFLWELKNLLGYFRLNLEFFYLAGGISTLFEGFILYRYYQTYASLNAFINGRKSQNWLLFKNNLVLFFQLSAIGLSLTFLRIFLFRLLY